MSAGWYPVSASRWLDPSSSLYALDYNVSPDIVSALIIKSQLKLQLVHAALGYNGKGMEDGVEWDATLQFVCTSKIIDYSNKCILEAILAACMWPAERVHKVADSFSPLCPRCGQEPESALHCFWTCPCNEQIEDQAVVSSQKLIPAAIYWSGEFPCMWLRGILPAKKAQVPPEHLPPDDIVIKFVTPPASYESGTYYGDSSGGQYTSTPPLRRCGCAVVQIDLNGDLVHAAYFSLPGSVQTVARGELYCLVWLCLNAEPESVITFVTDNKGVYTTYNKGPCAGALSSNADLYRTLFNTMYDKALKVAVTWMPSHLSPQDDRPAHVTELDVIGNKLADQYAGEMADWVQVPISISHPIIHHYNLIRWIQKRLTTIVSYFPDRAKHKKPPKLNTLNPFQYLRFGFRVSLAVLMGAQPCQLF